ncbi:MAG TPA: lipopolysaccharide kinase InaA family protein [Gemmataceae bacterium]
MNALPTNRSAPRLWQRWFHGTQAIRQDAEWSRFAGGDWAARIMAESVTDLLHEKQGRAIARWTLSNESRKLVVFLKRHYRLPRIHGVLAALFPRWAWSPGLQEWEHLQWASEAGFRVPRPMAAGQFLGPRGKLQSFLAVEELTGQLPLHQAVPLALSQLAPEAFARWKRGLTAELARIARELHRRRVFHKDLYFCHFYIDEALTRSVPESWLNRVVMIDLHRLARHPATALWWQVKDLAQLLYSSAVPGVTARDRLRFWKLYRGDWPGAPRNLLRPLIRLKWNLYCRHARRRQMSNVK